MLYTVVYSFILIHNFIYSFIKHPELPRGAVRAPARGRGQGGSRARATRVGRLSPECGDQARIGAPCVGGPMFNQLAGWLAGPARLLAGLALSAAAGPTSHCASLLSGLAQLAGWPTAN